MKFGAEMKKFPKLGVFSQSRMFLPQKLFVKIAVFSKYDVFYQNWPFLTK